MVQISRAATPLPAPGATRADLTRRRILEAASRVFQRQGLAATGMRDIAAELGMHVGNLYYYFEDRRDLLAFCQETTLERLLALATRVARASTPADEKLRALIAGHVVELNEAVPGSLAHLEVEAIDDHRRPAILARRDAYEESWRRVIEDGVASRVFRRVDPGTAARALLGAVNWTVKWYRAGGERTAAEIGDDFADLLVGGLLMHRAPKRTPAARRSTRRATR
ncbi:MAG TPA: TetR/AcrR family transcriptional regulator [Thermoanaerobaculia bacterium]|jgi:AcrR family transcriptional regulator|nr:TetR/AcrR family transcriptional regulator [Thermoanaerobaculia bacterium]